jgi:hypothetical protein
VRGLDDPAHNVGDQHYFSRWPRPGREIYPAIRVGVTHPNLLRRLHGLFDQRTMSVNLGMAFDNMAVPRPVVQNDFAAEGIG